MALRGPRARTGWGFLYEITAPNRVSQPQPPIYGLSMRISERSMQVRCPRGVNSGAPVTSVVTSYPRPIPEFTRINIMKIPCPCGGFVLGATKSTHACNPGGCRAIERRLEELALNSSSTTGNVGLAVHYRLFNGPPRGYSSGEPEPIAKRRLTKEVR
jgi:hypothetical protein